MVAALNFSRGYRVNPKKVELSRRCRFPDPVGSLPNRQRITYGRTNRSSWLFPCKIGVKHFTSPHAKGRPNVCRSGPPTRKALADIDDDE